MVLLATVIPALMALAAALVFLLWRRRQRVAASDAFLGKLALEEGGPAASPRSLRSRSLRSPRGSLADSLASDTRCGPILHGITDHMRFTTVKPSAHGLLRGVDSRCRQHSSCLL